MNKELKVIIGKEVLEFLLRTVEELAAKSGLAIAHHGAQDIVHKVKNTVQPYEEQGENAE
jgi:bifunctional N-acetylglucosamine-1-phosphate-uridyltransferase/glucosamine-1-phosphate-acetyltransferase GlmU-like protein